METLFNIFLLLIGLALVGVVLFVIISILHWLYRLIFFTFSFDQVKEMPGKVENMEYTAPQYSSTGKSTTYIPEKNEVIIKTELKSTTLDSDELYQRVRVGEKVTVKYQDRYMKPRFWDGKWELDGQRLISVTSALDMTVDFNDKKTATYKGNSRW